MHRLELVVADDVVYLAAVLQGGLFEVVNEPKYLRYVSAAVYYSLTRTR